MATKPKLVAEPQFKIEHGIPAPSRNGGSGNARFPLALMEVGDSFHVPWGDNPLKTRSVLSNAVAAYKLRNKPKDFVSSKDELGIRVWRVS